MVGVVRCSLLCHVSGGRNGVDSWKVLYCRDHSDIDPCLLLCHRLNLNFLHKRIKCK